MNNTREETGSGTGPQSAKQRTTKFISMEEAAELERRQAEVNRVSKMSFAGSVCLGGIEKPRESCVRTGDQTCF